MGVRMAIDDDEFLCGHCQLVVTWDDDGVCRDNCDRWVHATCQQFNDDEYKSL